MILTSEILEIRGAERKTSRKTGRDYLVVHLEEESGKHHDVLDRTVANEERYIRGKKARFQFDLRLINRFITLTVKSFDYIKEKEKENKEEEK